MKFSKLKAFHSAQVVTDFFFPPKGCRNANFKEIILKERRSWKRSKSVYIEVHVSCIIACVCVQHLHIF